MNYYLKSGPKAKLLNPNKAANDSSSEEDETPKKIPNGNLNAKPTNKKADSSDDSSDEEPPKKAPPKHIVKAPVKKKQESSEVSETLCNFTKQIRINYLQVRCIQVKIEGKYYNLFFYKFISFWAYAVFCVAGLGLYIYLWL